MLRPQLRFLCISPFLAFLLAALRSLHSPGVRQSVTVVELATISHAAWKLGVWKLQGGAEHERVVALIGALLVAPWGTP